MNKLLQHLGLVVICLLIAYQYHNIIAGHRYERVECWKRGGVLFDSLGTLICIQPETK